MAESWKTKRSLKRCKIFEVIREGIRGAEENGCGESGAWSARDPMDDLGFERAEGESPSKKAKSHERQGGKIRRVPKESRIAAINVPRTASSAEETHFVRASHFRNKIMLERSALPWLLKYIQEEMESGGVPPVELPHSSSSASQRDCSLYWDFRDDCWVASVRPQHADGKKRRGPVMSRIHKKGDVCFRMTRAEAKRHVKQELEEWLKAEGCTLPGESDSAPADAGTSIAAGHV